MEYKIVSLDDAEKWNTIVNRFNMESNVFYKSEYVKAFDIDNLVRNYRNLKETILFYYTDFEFEAMNVFEVEFNDERKEIKTPYGYGGMIFNNLNNKAQLDNLNFTFCKWCEENHVDSEFVRFSLNSEYINYYYGDVEFVKKNIIRYVDGNFDEIFKDFDYKVRKNLKSAMNNGLKISIDETCQTLDDFLRIYYNTMKRNNAGVKYFFSKDFFQELSKMKNNFIIFNVMFEGKIISTELVLYDDFRCYSFLGGTLKEYFQLRPNDFLKCEIIKWACKRNIKEFVLGGGYKNTDDDGIFKYKKSFAPRGEVGFYIGKCKFEK